MWRSSVRKGVLGVATVAFVLIVGVGCYQAPTRQFDPDTLGDTSDAVVIDGICPADIWPQTVTSGRDDAMYDNAWTLRGAAHPGFTTLSWTVPDLPGLDGYLVARLSRGVDWEIDVGDMRAFDVSDMLNDSDGYGFYVDSEGLLPGTEYWYRVFPVVAGELGFPSAPLEIWTPPKGRPLAPIWVQVEPEDGGRAEIEMGIGYHELKRGIRVARREKGDTDWQIVHDPPPPLGYDYELDEFDRWADQDIEPGAEYQYAVCQTSARGVSKAIIAEAAPVNLKTVPVDPPGDIKAVQSPFGITVFWEPSDDPLVTGYEVERVEETGDGDEYESSRFKTARGRAMNFVDFPFYNMPQRDRYRFRVRTVTFNGVGPWATELHVDAVQPDGVNSDRSAPTIESLSAIHDAVYLVWSAGIMADDTLFRFLRRPAHGSEEWDAYTYRGRYWVDEAEFDWDDRFSVEFHDLGWIDNVGVRPDTEYEYAVQLKRGESVESHSEPMSIRTRPLPATLDRLPLAVYDLEAELRKDGVQLTWTLPDDPTLKGLVVSETSYDHDIQSGRIERPALAPTATRYLVKHSDAIYGIPTCLFVQTFNDYGIQDMWRQPTCFLDPEWTGCGWSGEYIRGEHPSGIPMISFNGCDEMTATVVRHELTLDGFDTKTLVQPCRPSREVETMLIGPGEDWSCEYVDNEVKPGTLYVYELSQVFPDGTVSSSVYEFMTRPAVTGE